MSSACLRRRSTRTPYCDAAGSGAVGGGPAWVTGKGFASRNREGCRNRPGDIAVDRSDWQIKRAVRDDVVAMLQLILAAQLFPSLIG